MTDENSLDAGGWVARGDALSKQGRYEEALEELNRTAGRMGVGRAGCGVAFGSWGTDSIGGLRVCACGIPGRDRAVEAYGDTACTDTCGGAPSYRG
jgi:hypothetical protein